VKQDAKENSRVDESMQLGVKLDLATRSLVFDKNKPVKFESK